jgi:hypothetical protein
MLGWGWGSSFSKTLVCVCACNACKCVRARVCVCVLKMHSYLHTLMTSVIKWTIHDDEEGDNSNYHIKMSDDDYALLHLCNVPV